MASAANDSLRARLAAVKPVPASVQLLQRQLTNGDAAVREAGLVSITKVRPPAEPLTDLIARLLEHENWYVKRTGAAAITKCAELEDAAQIAVHQIAAVRLTHEDPEVRRCAARALIAIIKSSMGEGGSHTAGLGVTKTVFGRQKEFAPPKRSMDGEGDDENDDARSTASEDSMAGSAPVGSIANSVGQLALEEIIMRLQHDNPDVRQLVIDSLNQLGPISEPYAFKISCCIADPDIRVRNAAMESFRFIGVHLNAGVDEVANLLRHPDESIRIHAKRTIHVIAEHSGQLAAERVAAQLPLIEKHAESLREKRAPTLGKHEADKRPGTEFADIKTCKRAILTVICELGALTAPHSKNLIHYLDERDVEIRSAAVRAIVCSETESGSTIKLLRRKLDHPDAEIRRAAQDVLRGLAGQSLAVASAIGKIFVEDTSETTPEALRLRRQCMQILGGAGKNATRFLVDIARELENNDFQVRRAALEAIQDLGEHAKGACVEIGRRLLHSDPVVRRIAVETIGRMGAHAGQLIPRVEGMVDIEEDADVKNAILAALNVAKQFVDSDQKANTGGTRGKSVNQVRRNSGALSPSSPKSPKKK
eukprot:TRINITY_DN79393_c0_g1_i1.p1 TRINITY_DN79393_c0_g1~~TRINITY_DN79393_c0_g1_i1.p1  ORF type:complete len:609 (-),score=93.73 TRINITY_DN79393_c0_g1_i1:30-1811(-)